MRSNHWIGFGDIVIFDVNVVIAAHRADHPHHDGVRPWFDGVVAEEDFGVPATVWASFLRLVTHRRVFNEPSTRDEAFEFIIAVRAQGGHISVEPGPRHLDLLRALCDEADALADLIPDAVLGAVAIEHGATVATLDRDFARFPTVIA